MVTPVAIGFAAVYALLGSTSASKKLTATGKLLMSESRRTDGEL